LKAETLKTTPYVTGGSVAGCRNTVCKFRGITLNYTVSQLVNFDLIKEMVVDADETARITVHTDKKIKRKRQGLGLDIVTEPEDKLYRMSFLKQASGG
jgi:predicted amino acid-binding ACT domain protein